MASDDRPKTDTTLSDGLRKFMQLPPAQRDEHLYLQQYYHKSILDSVRAIPEIMNGTTEKPGLVVRVDWIEAKIKKLTRSNENLTKALYLCTGAFIMFKLLWPLISPLLTPLAHK